MIGQGILVCILGVAILTNILWLIHRGRRASAITSLPEILTASYLIIAGILVILRTFSRLSSPNPNYAALILVFLPAAMSLSIKNPGEFLKERPAGIWLAIATGLTIFALTNHDNGLVGTYGIPSTAAILLFLCVAMVIFRGFLKFLLGLAMLIWGAHIIEIPPMGILGISIFMGAVAFSSTAYFAQNSSLSGLECSIGDLLSSIENPFIILDLTGKIVFANDGFLLLCGHDKSTVIGSDGINYFDIQSDWRLKSDSREIIKKIRCHLLTKNGGKIAVHLWLNEILNSGTTLRNLLCIITDDSERESLESKLKVESARFACLYETSLALSSSLELRDVLKSISEAAEALTRADSCTIFALDHARQIIKPIFSTEAIFNSEVMNFELPVGHGLTGRVIQDGKARIQNYDDELKLSKQVPGTSEIEESLLSIPLVARDVVIGALTIYKLGCKKFEEDDLRVFTVFAAQASAIIQTSRLYMRLKESEKLYRYSVDLSADAIFFVDFENGKINDANETACQMFKYSKSELVSMSIWELQPETEMHTARELWQKTRKNGRFMLNEMGYRTKDDEIIPASVNVSAIFAGDTNFIQWTVRDISAFKTVLEKSGLFHQIFERLDEPIFFTDSKGKPIYANELFCSLFGLDHRFIERNDILSISLQNPKAIILKSCWIKLKGQDNLVETIDLGLDSSNPIKKMLTILPQRDEKGKIEYYIWFFSPITEAISARKSISVPFLGRQSSPST
jgi:PAS domain S-box-containing protein